MTFLPAPIILSFFFLSFTLFTLFAPLLSFSVGNVLAHPEKLTKETLQWSSPAAEQTNVLDKSKLAKRPLWLSVPD